MALLLKIVRWTLLVVVGFVGIFILWAWSSAWFPDKPTQREAVACTDDAPMLRAGQEVKVLSWNVQFMAGKNYAFFFEGGTDTRPSSEDITLTLAEVARIIEDENPDIILLQEMDNGAARTDHEDQTARLLRLISPDYLCSARAFYWKGDYVLHPSIMGSVGMELTTFSKYKIEGATRHALYEIPGFFLEQWFNLKRAILEVSMPVTGGEDFYALNTHFSAFAQGTDTMVHQVSETIAVLEALSEAGKPWLIGGDFNLLPPVIDRGALSYGDAQALYKDGSEISRIFDRFKSAATLEQLTGAEAALHYTHYSNNPSATGLDRVIDYIFYSDLLGFTGYNTRQHDTLAISDHLPVIMSFRMPG